MDSPTCLWNSLLNYKVIETPLCIPSSFACSEMIIRLRFRPQHHQLNALADSSDFPINFWCHRQHIRAIQRKTSRISALGKCFSNAIQWSHLMHSPSRCDPKAYICALENLFIGLAESAEKRQALEHKALDADFVVHFVAWFIAQLHHFRECLRTGNCVARKRLSTTLRFGPIMKHKKNYLDMCGGSFGYRTTSPLALPLDTMIN